MQTGDVIIVKADDPAAEEDISRWVTRTGHELMSCVPQDNVITFTIKKVK